MRWEVRQLSEAATCTAWYSKLSLGNVALDKSQAARHQGGYYHERAITSLKNCDWTMCSMLVPHRSHTTFLGNDTCSNFWGPFRDIRSGRFCHHIAILWWIGVERRTSSERQNMKLHEG